MVPGAVSAEVYADLKTTAEQMVMQGREIAKWHERVVVKLPTTVAGLKARSILRIEGIPINNTLVFSQEQIYAICLQESIIQQQYHPKANTWPCFISPFVGRIDDMGENGIDLIRNGMHLKQLLPTPIWMLEASVRTIAHMAKGIQSGTELITAPAKVYREWLMLKYEEKENATEESESLIKIEPWVPSSQIQQISTLEAFEQAVTSNLLDVRHELTDKGITKFAEDWIEILL
ncbi:hypothetical protein BH11PAT1_BH11PAT1_2790 [soil metagenome]